MTEDYAVPSSKNVVTQKLQNPKTELALAGLLDQLVPTATTIAGRAGSSLICGPLFPMEGDSRNRQVRIPEAFWDNVDRAGLF